VLATLATYSNLNKGSSYVQKSFSLAAYKGQTVQIYFEASKDPPRRRPSCRRRQPEMI
jgi:hypothetical protein